LVIDVSREHGISVIMVTHSVDDALRVSDKIYAFTGKPIWKFP